MKFLHIIMLCCFSVVCLYASDVVEVSGHVGGQASVHCSGSWTTNNSSEHYNMYFCKGDCSKENILIQCGRRKPAVTWRGKYRVEVNRGHGSFNVTIMRLKRADAGKYCCGVEESFNTLHQGVSLKVLNASIVPPGSSPSTTLQRQADVVSEGRFPSSTESSPASLLSPVTERTLQQVTASLTEDLHDAVTRAKACLSLLFTDTTVVIIVSVSLALLVCAVIPLIFYGHWRSNAARTNLDENKGEDDYCEENKAGASGQTEVRLRALEPDADPESGAQDLSQHADSHQVLDPKSLN